MTEIYRAIKYGVEPIKSNVPIHIFSSTDISEEVNIPSVKGCDIEVAREVPESWSGVKKVVSPPSKWICHDQRGNR